MQHLYGDTSTTVTIIYISYQIDHDQQTFLPSSQSQLQHLEIKQNRHYGYYVNMFQN